MPPFSVLDLAPVTEGSNARQALLNSRDLAQAAERLGYKRFWLAEHHNMSGIASAATSVAIANAANATTTIRVGAGGIMLPNHAPLVIAEQFGTLEALFPGRIDLGLGRAPGTDQATWRALRRDATAAERFPQDVLELQALLGQPAEGQRIHAVPGEESEIPLWILGSSLFGAQLAAMLGLPFAFASHFAPDALLQALSLYRSGFKPSKQLDKPYAMVGCNVIAAETDAEAWRLFTSQQQAYTRMLRNARGKLPPPIDDIETFWTTPEKVQASRMLRCAFVGARDTVLGRLAAFIGETQADEVIVGAMIYDHGARVRSYEILAEAVKDLP